MDIARSLVGREMPGVAKVLDVGDGYVVMERAPGDSLKTILKRTEYKRGMPPDLAAEIVRKTARSLESMHRAGLVHQDVAPDNIMVELRPNGKVGKVTLIDPFVASPPTDSGPGDNAFRVGKSAFISPEQIRGEGISGKSDIFSLGKVFYRLLTGRHLFEEQGYDNVKSLTANENIHINHPALQVETVPQDLRPLMADMLSQSRQRRPNAAQIDTAVNRYKSNSDAVPDFETSVRNSMPDNTAGTVVRDEPTARAVDDMGGTGRVAGQPVKTEGVPDFEVTVVERGAPKGAPVDVTPPPSQNPANKPPGFRLNPSLRGMGIGVGSTALGLGVGFGTHYLLGQAGVESEGVKIVAAIGTGHGTGVGLTYLATGKMPGIGTQAKGLVLGLGGAFLVNDCIKSFADSAGAGADSWLRSTPVNIAGGVGGGVAFTAAGTVALPFAGFAIANEAVKQYYSPEDQAAKQSDIGRAREQMRKTYENGIGFQSAVAVTALTLTFVPIFDGLIMLGSDATAPQVDVNDPNYSTPDRLTPNERKAQAHKEAQAQAPKTPANPLLGTTRFIPGFTPPMSSLPTRF
ncbi:MAG: serine/threonine-protein kinase [Candidatus Margulisiibacteriota bacterium]